jgi:hypothetical protein
MATANRYLQTVYLPAFNAEFAVPAMEAGSAFVPWIGGSLDDILCEQYARTVGHDNCVRFEKLICKRSAVPRRFQSYREAGIFGCKGNRESMLLLSIPSP